tara:strand:- start:789 stop:1085 length:297 start_codon:yes stop_codon:yes gene_type:complete
MYVISREFVENAKSVNVMTALENGNLSKTSKQSRDGGSVSGKRSRLEHHSRQQVELNSICESFGLDLTVHVTQTAYPNSNNCHAATELRKKRKKHGPQ